MRIVHTKYVYSVVIPLYRSICTHIKLHFHLRFFSLHVHVLISRGKQRDSWKTSWLQCRDHVFRTNIKKFF